MSRFSLNVGKPIMSLPFGDGFDHLLMVISLDSNPTFRQHGFIQKWGRIAKYGKDIRHQQQLVDRTSRIKTYTWKWHQP